VNVNRNKEGVLPADHNDVVLGPKCCVRTNGCWGNFTNAASFSPLVGHPHPPGSVCGQSHHRRPAGYSPELGLHISVGYRGIGWFRHADLLQRLYHHGRQHRNHSGGHARHRVNRKLFLFQNPVSLLQIGGVAVTILGVVFVSIHGEFERLMTLSFNTGDLLMLIAVLLYGSYTLGLRRKNDLSSIALFASVVASAFISTLPLTIYEFVSGRTIWPELQDCVLIGMIVLFPSFLSQICFIASVKLIGPARSGMFINLVPVFASFFAVVLLEEDFELFHGLSLLLVLSGIYIFEKYKPITT